MACQLFSAKPVSESVLDRFINWTKRNGIQCKFHQNILLLFNIIYSKYHLWNGGGLFSYSMDWIMNIWQCITTTYLFSPAIMFVRKGIMVNVNKEVIFEWEENGSTNSTNRSANYEFSCCVQNLHCLSTVEYNVSFSWLPNKKCKYKCRLFPRKDFILRIS